MLIDNPKGNFKFIKGFGPVSFDCLADPGYEVVHAIIKPSLPIARGYDFIERTLRGLGRPLSALCEIELRIPRPLSAAAFAEFNRPYQLKLESWNLAVAGLNPVARTNVASAIDPVAEPVVYGFSYTMPSRRQAPSFVFAGMAEVRAGKAGEFEFIAGADTSTAGLRLKLEFIIEAIGSNLREMKASWQDVTTVELYTVHDVHPLLESLLPLMPGVSRSGIRWHYAHPPVTDIKCEIGIRAVHQEIILAGEADF